MRSFVRVFITYLYAIATLTTFGGLTENISYGQTAAGAIPSAREKSLLFEVASIKPSFENEPFKQQVTPDGFLLRNGSVSRLLGLIYDPARLLRGTRLRNAPDWVRNDGVDISAKVSPEDAADWQRETTSGFGSPALAHALQQILVERYKLQAHTIPIEVDGYTLVVERSGPKTNLVTADKVRPSPDTIASEVVLPGGIIKFHNQPLSKLALFIGNLSSSIVEDRTGLTDRYDFSISDRLPTHPTAQESEDLTRPEDRWDLKPLGLRVVRSKVHTTALVIDYIEKPSPN